MRVGDISMIRTRTWITPLLFVLASGVLVDRTSAQDEQGRKRDAPLTHYLGREIAQTMHWMGAGWLMRETREKEENGVRLRELLHLKPGQTVCDLGCGNGYHTLPLARAVGERGRVLAVDLQPEMLEFLRGRAEEQQLKNIEYVEAKLDDPRLRARSCDLILMVDVYHELSYPVKILRRLRAALKPRGRLVLVEFRAEDAGVPIKPLHKMTKAQVIQELATNGFRFAEESDELPWQHVLAFERLESEEDLKHIDQWVARQVAEGLWRAWRAGDTETLSGFYAEHVQVLPGSELLKQEHGGEPEERTNGARMARGIWLRRLAAMIEQFGADRWSEALGAWRVLPLEPVGENSPVEGAEYVLTVGPDDETGTDDRMHFYFGRDGSGRWRLVGEATDF